MKLFAALVLAVALTCTPTTHAQTIEQTLTTLLAKADSTQEKVYAVHDLLQTAANKRESLRAEGATAQKRLDDINVQTANYTAVIQRHNDAVGQHEAAMQTHDARTAQHNANRCTYYEGHEQDCAGYNAEQDNLNREGFALDRDTTVLNNEKATLDAAGDGLQMQINDFNKYREDFNARNDANEHSIDVLMRVLNMLRKTTASCQDVLQNPKSTPEAIHESCGQGFDGNDTHGPLTRSGTGGASSNGRQ